MGNPVLDLPGRLDAAWPFEHPPRGTCWARCPAYGRCHCGCGGATKPSRLTDKNTSRERDAPSVFSPGHYVRLFHPRVGHFGRTGVDVERVRPLIYWLREQHGSMRAVADFLRIPESTLRGYAYKRGLKRVPPDAADRVTRGVLAHRPGAIQWNTLE